MSIVYSLRKLVDPVGHRAVEEELRRQREDQPQDPKGGGDGPPRGAQARLRQPRYVCRVCRLRADDGSYCPVCLAGTMVEV